MAKLSIAIEMNALELPNHLVRGNNSFHYATEIYFNRSISVRKALRQEPTGEIKKTRRWYMRSGYQL